MHLGEDVEELDEDQGCEGDAHDVHERVLEEDDREKHDHGALEDADPHPDEEGLEVQRATLLKRLVERGELHDLLQVHILVEDQSEDRHRSIDRGVAHHEIAVVDGDCHKEKDDREDSLNNGDDQTAMDDELGQHS